MNSINGSSIILTKMTYATVDHSLYKNFIVLSFPDINDIVKIVLPRVARDSFRIINFSSFKKILQNRYGEDDIINMFTSSSKTIVNVEFCDETGTSCVCGSRKIEDCMVLQ